jgi:lipopolysaccharide export LptBFGC system permease protein LptF
MKILDRYIAKSFLIGYAIAFCVLIGLRVIIDLFVNLDEFAEHATDLGTWGVAKNILTFYGLNVTLYFRDIAGVITVVAAAFSLGKMVRANELVAIIASGVSAKRIVGPILLLAVLFAGLAMLNQEVLIPSFSDKLVRDHDDVPGQESYDVWFITDENGSLICSRRFDVETATFQQPTIITRTPAEDLGMGIWRVTGRISADLATYNEGTKKWDLDHGSFIGIESTEPERIASYDAGGLLPKDISVRRKAGYKSYLSLPQLNALAKQNTKVKDMAQLLSQKHFRITEPIINLTMLMVALPVLICRDPRAMKSAIVLSFTLTAACFVTTFVCKMLATEVVFGNEVMPEFWAWLPVFIFMPIAFVALDSMRT